MHEDHAREQYFFDPPTIAEALGRAGRPVRLLEVDERFAHLPGFLRWDLYRPQALDGDADSRPDVIFCDPPFRKVTLAQLFTALRVLCRDDFGAPILLCHLRSRAADVVGALARFGLQPTDIEPGCVTVKPTEENRILLYANFALPASL